MPKEKIRPTPEARSLATRVVKESNGLVTFGRTNGKICLHVQCGPQSRTIFTQEQWEKCVFRKPPIGSKTSA